jgi:hypothetical protein
MKNKTKKKVFHIGDSNIVFNEDGFYVPPAEPQETKEDNFTRWNKGLQPNKNIEGWEDWVSRFYTEFCVKSTDGKWYMAEFFDGGRLLEAKEIEQFICNLLQSQRKELEKHFLFAQCEALEYQREQICKEIEDKFTTIINQNTECKKGMWTNYIEGLDKAKEVLINLINSSK